MHGVTIPQGEAVDCTDVAIGNSDIESSSTWAPPQGEPERAPLPIYPNRDLLDALDELLAGINRMVSECPPAFAGMERRS